MYEYRCEIVRVVDGDTVDVNIDLGFDTWIHKERIRLKGISITSGGTAGTISFINGTPETGTTLFTARTIGTANEVVDRTIPAEGLLFASGMTVSYTLDHADMMTFFFT